MSALTEMYQGSFRGVEFFVSSSNVEGGRKTATHEFTNSNFREVEDLGKNLKKFSLTARVYDTGGSFVQKKTRLMEALDKKGEGKLVHPWYGEFDVKAKTYTVSDDITRIGESVFTMSFEIESEQIIKRKTFDIAGAILKSNESLTSKLGLDVAQSYFSSGINAINSATEFVTEVSDKIDSITSLYTRAFTSVSNLVSSVQGLKNDVTQLVNLPDRMAGDLLGMFDRIGDVFVSRSEEISDTRQALSDDQKAILSQIDLTDTINNINAQENQELEQAEASDLDETEKDINLSKFAVLESLFDFNKDSTRIVSILGASSQTIGGEDVGITAAASIDIGNDITAEEAEIINNEKLLTRLMRAKALADAYVTISDIDFTSVDEIEDYQGRLELQYQAVITDPDIPTDTYRLIQKLRDLSERFFFDKKLTTNQVIDIDIKNTPAQVLAFNLYGDDGNYRTLVNLNSTVDVSRMTGTVKVVTS